MGHGARAVLHEAIGLPSNVKPMNGRHLRSMPWGGDVCCFLSGLLLDSFSFVVVLLVLLYTCLLCLKIGGVSFEPDREGARTTTSSWQARGISVHFAEWGRGDSPGSVCSKILFSLLKGAFTFRPLCYRFEPRCATLFHKERKKQ